MYPQRRSSCGGPRRPQLETGKMKYSLLNGGGMECYATSDSWYGPDLCCNGQSWLPQAHYGKLNLVPDICNVLMKRRFFAQKQNQCSKSPLPPNRAVQGSFKNSPETHFPMRNVNGMSPTVVGLCCHVHASGPTDPGHLRPATVAAALQPSRLPKTYASAVKRPKGPTTSALTKMPDRPKHDQPPDTVRLQKLTAARIRRAADRADPKPVRMAPPPQNGRKCKKFHELKEMLASASPGTGSPTTSQILASVSNGNRRNSIDYAVTCVVGTRSSVKGLECGSKSAPVDRSLTPCLNPHIAFIMGVVCSEEADNFDDDDWDSSTEYDDHQAGSPPLTNGGPITIIKGNQSDLCSKMDHSSESSPADEPFLNQFQPEVSASMSPEQLAEINRKWSEAYGGPDGPALSQKVSFREDDALVTVHDIGESYDRKGPWEEYARDRCRFSRRIQEMSLVIGPILNPDHRRKVYVQQVLPQLGLP